MHQFFKSPFFNFEFIRLLGAAFFEGCEVGEALESVAKIKDQDPESWYISWTEAGVRAEAIAKEATKSGDKNATRKAFLRASNYFRAAQFMFNSRPGFHDARALESTERSISNFKKGIHLLPGKVYEVEIPYGSESKLPGYLYLPPAGKRLPGGKTPILISTGGLDSTVEELYFIGAASGPDLGYAVLTFEGPGQGVVLRRDKLHMRSDWEVVTGSVLDYLFDFAPKHPDLDLDLERIAIHGATLGGYYALRGAADPRIAAVIAVDPFYSMWEVASTRMPGLLISAWTSGWLSDRIFNGIINLVSKLQFQVGWEFNQVQWAFGVDTPAKAMREMQRFALRTPDGGEYLDTIKCPVFVTGAAASIYATPDPSATKIFGKLHHLPDERKRLWIGKDVSDGGLQAKVGAFGLAHQRNFTFLDEQFKIERKPVVVVGV
ncbi:alpha/beta-hydrolase [Acephala macrosclerotiorum]|nr:alpha/beta-hydrolase [Acephala macrosclerotiorum]